MDTLLHDLQKTIEALETLGESSATAGEQIDELLDPLFQHKIDLVGATLNVSTLPYQQAAQAMRQAADKAERAAKEPGRVGEAARAVAEATAKLAKLQDSLFPLS